MSKQWNDDQLKAITLRNKNIMVSASAGSGKTGVLIQRLVDLVTKDKIELNQILAMTFTNAAAAEMKKRLTAEITKLVEQEKNPDELIYLNKQLIQCSTAQISTIHSFCLSIIQNYYYVINCSLKRVNNTLDQATQSLYQQMAVQSILDNENQLCEQSFVDLNSLLSPRPEEVSTLKKLIIKIAELASAQVDAKQWLLKSLAHYESKNSLDEVDEEIREPFYDYLLSLVNNYLECLDKIKYLYELKYNQEEKKMTIFYNKLEALPMIHKAMKDKNYEQLRSAFITIAKVVIPTAPDSEDKEYSELRKQSQAIEDDFAGFFPEHVLLKQCAQTYPLLEKCIQCVLAYLDKYEEIKIEHECIDFNDMEHLALAILKANNNEVANIYKDRFKEIMVDEFQDSNDVQDALVQLITTGTNVFRVGDVKQSIYGFRHASPSIMQAYKRLNDQENECIIFKKNYRSSETIVEFNNLLYKTLMNIDGFKSLPFQSEDLVGIGGDYQKKVQEPILFHALSLEDIEVELGYKAVRDELKASYIANQILEIKEKYQYQYKDFVVLVRSHDKMNALKKVFEEINLPFYMESKHGFYSSYAIQILVSTLRCLVNEKDDLNFVALLSSPLIKLSSEDLVVLKQSMQDKEHYVDVFKRMYPDLYNEFNSIQELTKGSMSKCINECLKWNHFYEDACSIQDQTNLDLLFSKACDYEQKKGSSLPGFLDSLSLIPDEESAEASSVGKDANVVRFMTIHQSKGLEFPVVFLWASSTMKNKASVDPIILDNKLGLGFKSMSLPQRLTNSTLVRMAIEHKLNRESLEEEMRILYVATTRAKDQMHVIDYVKDVNTFMDGLSQSKIYARKGTTSWILGTLMKNSTSLFRVMNVKRSFSNKTQEKIMHERMELPRFNGDVHPIKLSTPSTSKLQSLDPVDLTTQKDKTSIGNAYHKLIETLPLCEWERNCIEETAKNANIQLITGMSESLIKLSQHPLFKETFNYEEVYHEYPFQVMVDNECIHGYIDYVAIHNNQLVLIDFKSDMNVSSSILHERYDEQVLSYMKALHHLYPNNEINAYLYSLPLNEMIKVN